MTDEEIRERMGWDSDPCLDPAINPILDHALNEVAVHFRRVFKDVCQTVGCLAADRLAHAVAHYARLDFESHTKTCDHGPVPVTRHDWDPIQPASKLVQ
jgi:hypothetical protein